MTKIYFSLWFAFIGIVLYAQPGTQSDVITIDSYQPFQGYDETAPHLGQGQYQIFYDNINGVLDKPFILVDGYDPEDENTIPIIYNFLNYTGGNLFNDMRNQGMDIIILNFPNYTRADDSTLIHGGADYIERNGLVLVNLLQTINPQLPVGNDCIVMGVSMGGLVSRYGLRFMEQNALTHNTGLWFSFDSPHRGANVPISLQYAFNYIAESTDNDEMRANRDLTFNSPAAKQMLLDHYTAHLQSGNAYEQNTAVQLPTPAATFRTTFENTMNTMGFPVDTRKAAIANGSINNTMVESPGALIVDTTVSPAANTNTQIKMYFTPNANTSNYQIDYIRTTLFGFEAGLFTAVAASPTTSAGLDSAPGGTVLLQDYFGNTSDPTIQQIINALQVEEFSFIPTLSSLAVENSNWYTAVNTSMVTNFNAYIAPTVNEPHVTLSQPTLNFILTEITNHLSTDQIALEQNFVLLQNPTQNFIRFKLLDTRYSSVEVYLYNLSGQILNNNNISFENDIYQINAPAQQGIYLLQVNTDKGSITKKVIIK